MCGASWVTCSRSKAGESADSGQPEFRRPPQPYHGPVGDSDTREHGQSTGSGSRFLRLPLGTHTPPRLWAIGRKIAACQALTEGALCNPIARRLRLARGQSRLLRGSCGAPDPSRVWTAAVRPHHAGVRAPAEPAVRGPRGRGHAATPKGPWAAYLPTTNAGLASSTWHRRRARALRGRQRPLHMMIHGGPHGRQRANP
ncbi:hypothetical protein HPB47_002214 [Ixodes persulcatus]|uniref:Uncharacterized protein n=1 Tax=Ixodes persulcatus TaxID=34615 RepID=A0AC60PN29_IXOPE|nr:hypothetical protein HPB47_002214 [Ixodes persulcatus]